MCKQQGHSFCSELGADSALWSKNAPLDKPEWIDESYLVLERALKLTLEDAIGEAKSLLKNSRDLEMREWFDVHAQNSGGWRNKVLKVPAPEPILPLDSVKTFAAFETTVFTRDGFKCRYCSSNVLPKKTFKQANLILGDDALPLGKTNATRSGFYLMFVATLDHLLPWSLGGRTNESNLVTCCWSCNYGKANFTVDQLGINNPLI
jgi:5-methylcytosine-specific restriction endonuclease McrA